MSTLFWPGDHRAGDLFSDAGLVCALTAVEAAWLATLVDLEVAPSAAADGLADLLDPTDIPDLAAASEGGGNPVIPLLKLLRARLEGRNHTAADWVHRGLTSQDVLDTALVLMARDACSRVLTDVRDQINILAGVAVAHRATAMTGRTLTQPAVPITFGAKAASWLHGVLDAHDVLVRLELRAQLGGAAGTRSGAAAITAGLGLEAATLGTATAARLGLVASAPWPTARAPVTAVGDALTVASSAWGRIANDVLTLSRPEIGEVSEPTADGRGGSSAMPQKANPTLSVLIRRAALTAPALASLLNLAAADARDERPDGAWHVEWQPLQLLARHAVTAAEQTTELLAGLRVHAEAMAANLDAARPGVDAERTTLADGRHVVPGDGAIIDSALERARTVLDGLA